MKKTVMLFVVLCFSMGMVGGAGAALIVDQEQATWTKSYSSINMACDPIGQEFIPDVSNLAAVEIGISILREDIGPAVSVNVRENTINGAIVGTGSIDATVTGWNLIELDSYAWLTVGQTYVLDFISGYPNLARRDYGYEDGRSIAYGNFRDCDLLFRTYYEDTAAVPIPGAVWLLGSGLLGLVGLHRQREHG